MQLQGANGISATAVATGSGRMIRGGCWYSNARYCRSAQRNYYAPRRAGTATSISELSWSQVSELWNSQSGAVEAERGTSEA